MYRHCLLWITLITSSLTAGSLYAETTPTVNINTSHALSLHGTPKYGPDATHFEYANPDAPKGGDFRIATVGTFDSLNPFIPKGNTASNMGLFYDSLTVSSDDEAFSQYGLIAEKIEWPEDRSWVVFHINPNAKFHDGKAITAEDVVFSFNILLEKGDPFYKFYYADVERAEAISPLQAKFFFKPTENQELIPILGQLYIFPKHYWEDKDFAKADLTVPVGSGAYKIAKINAGKQIVFKRNKNYWAEETLPRNGFFNFDSVTVDYYRDQSVRFEAFKAGEFDYNYELTAKTWATGYDFDAVTKGEIVKEVLGEGGPKGMTGILFNLRKPKFQNTALREAFDLVFDFEWTNANIFYNSYHRSYSYFTNSELAATGMPSGRELEILNAYKDRLSPDVFGQVYTPPVTDGSGKNRKNLRKALTILKAAGYTIIDNKLIDPASKKPVEVEFLISQATFQRIINPFAKNLERIGVKATVRLVDQSQYINRVREFDFDMMIGSIPQSLSPGNEQYEMWHSSAADKPSTRNAMGLKDPLIDEMVELIVRAPNREELVAATRAFDRVLLHKHLVVPLYHSNKHRIAYWNKFDRPQVVAPYDTRYASGMFSWWYNPEKAKK